jgi:hypothetical protein
MPGSDDPGHNFVAGQPIRHRIYGMVYLVRQRARSRPRNYSWAELSHRVFSIDVLECDSIYLYAQEYSKALGRTITFQDIPLEPWRDELLKRGLPVHLVNHLATMADLHRAGRYDRRSDDVLTLTGQRALSMQEFVRKNAATFTALVSTA